MFLSIALAGLMIVESDRPAGDTRWKNGRQRKSNDSNR